MTPEHEKYCRGLLDLEGGVMTGGPYAQDGPKLRVIFPGWTGGGNWNGAAFFPELGLLHHPVAGPRDAEQDGAEPDQPKHVTCVVVRTTRLRARHQLLGWGQGLAVSAAAVGRAHRGQREHGRCSLAHPPRVV